MRVALFPFFAACTTCPPGQHVEEENCHEEHYLLCTVYDKYGICELSVPMPRTVCEHVCVGPIQAEEES